MAYVSAYPDAVGRETHQLFNEVSKSMNEHSRKSRDDGPQNTYQATAPEINLSNGEGRQSGY